MVAARLCAMNECIHNKLVASTSMLGQLDVRHQPADEPARLSLPSLSRLLIAHRTPPGLRLTALDLLPPLTLCETLKTSVHLHILPRRLCKIRILASSSSAMVRADFCRCSGAFRAGLSYPFMNAGRVEKKPVPLQRHVKSRTRSSLEMFGASSKVELPLAGAAV